MMYMCVPYMRYKCAVSQVQLALTQNKTETLTRATELCTQLQEVPYSICRSSHSARRYSQSAYTQHILSTYSARRYS